MKTAPTTTRPRRVLRALFLAVAFASVAALQLGVGASIYETSSLQSTLIHLHRASGH